MEASDLAKPGIWGFWVAMIVAIWQICSHAEGVVSPSLKATIINWFKSAIRNEGANWNSIITDSFEKIFGKEQWSKKSIIASCLISVIPAIGVGMMLSWLYTVVLVNLSDQPKNKDGILDFIIFALPAVIPGYLSVWKTRLLLRYIDRRPSKVLTGLFFLGDLAGSIGIWYVTPTLFYVLPSIIGGTPLTPDSLTADRLFSNFGPLSFLPSFPAAIALSYSIAGFAIRKTRFIISSLLDIDDKPVQVVGLIAMCLLSVLYWLLIGIFFLG